MNPLIARILTVFVAGGIAAVAGDGSIPSGTQAAFAAAGMLLGALLPQLFASTAKKDK